VSSTFAHVAEWASIVGAAGVFIALGQLVRTKRAVTAATEAIERADKSLAANQVLVLLPQLQKLEPDLDAAVAAEAREAVLRHLAEWRRLATELDGLVRNQPYAEANALNQLRASAVAAATAKSQLLNTDRDLVTGTNAVRREVAEACAYIGTLSGHLRAYSEPGEH
jgi:hypothetical protein